MIPNHLKPYVNAHPRLKHGFGVIVTWPTKDRNASEHDTDSSVERLTAEELIRIQKEIQQKLRGDFAALLGD